MIDFSSFAELPDSMPAIEILRAFDTVVATGQVGVDQRIAAADALVQLAIRYWHTYEHLPDDYKTRLHQWIRANWQPLDAEFIDSCGTIIGCLGLENTFCFVETELQSPQIGDARIAMLEIVNELAPHVGDPYFLLKEQIREKGGDDS